MPTDIGVHDLTSNTSHSPFKASATSNFAGNDPYKAFDSAAGNSFWIGTGGGVDKLQLDRGPATAFFSDSLPHDLTNASSHSPFVVSSSSAHGSFPNYNVLDGSLTSYWLGQTGGGVDWWKVDIGSGNTQIVRSYWVTVNQVPEPTRAPKDWTFEGSNDNSSWTTLHTVTNQTGWDSGETRYFEPTDVSTAYRYFRINFTANNGDATYVQMAEIHMFTTALDRSRNKVCGSYKIKVLTTANRDPKNWKLQGNKYEGGGWIDLDTQTNQTGWTNNEERTFTCAGGGAAYQAFRVNITANNGDATYTEVGELTLLEGATTVDDSISLGVSVGESFAETVQAAAAIAPGVSVEITPSTQVAAVDAITLGAGAGFTPASLGTFNSSITLGAAASFTPQSIIAVNSNIQLDAGGLDVHITRFVDADIAIGVGAGLALADALAGNHPEVFTPASEAGTPSGWRPATEPGTPSGFKPITGSGTPGIFKP